MDLCTSGSYLLFYSAHLQAEKSITVDGSRESEAAGGLPSGEKIERAISGSHLLRFPPMPPISEPKYMRGFIFFQGNWLASIKYFHCCYMTKLSILHFQKYLVILNVRKIRAIDMVTFACVSQLLLKSALAYSVFLFKKICLAFNAQVILMSLGTTLQDKMFSKY
jgi:hypothetical protein